MEPGFGTGSGSDRVEEGRSLCRHTSRRSRNATRSGPAFGEQAEDWAAREPALASFVHATILKHDFAQDALSYHLAKKIGSDDMSPMITREIFQEAVADDGSIGEAVRADLSAVFERDPACNSHIEAFLFYKGFHALECYRVGTGHGDTTVARWRSYFRAGCPSSSVSTSIRRRLGRGIMIDHATGVVIGENGGRGG